MSRTLKARLRSLSPARRTAILTLILFLLAIGTLIGSANIARPAQTERTVTLLSEQLVAKQGSSVIYLRVSTAAGEQLLELTGPPQPGATAVYWEHNQSHAVSWNPFQTSWGRTLQAIGFVSLLATIVCGLVATYEWINPRKRPSPTKRPHD